MFTRSVPAPHVRANDLGNVEMAVSLDFCISTRPGGNDFRKPRGNHGNRHFQMSTIFTPTGDQPALDMVGRPRYLGGFESGCDLLHDLGPRR